MPSSFRGHKRAWLAVTVYAVLFLVAMIPLALPGAGALSGLWVTVLAMPWTALGVFVSDLIDPSLMDSWPVFLSLPILGGGINAALIFYTVRWLSRSSGTGPDESTGLNG